MATMKAGTSGLQNSAYNFFTAFYKWQFHFINGDTKKVQIL